MVARTSPVAVIEQWASAPEISARSVLVTIIGDTLIPVDTSIWMSQMLELTEGFGFSERLVRTSMNRLVAEEWLYTERVGRRSRYHLTDLALTESARAAERIYGSGTVDWSGEWVLVFLPDALRAAEVSRIVEHFRWNGFVPIAGGVLASPDCDPDSARKVLDVVAPDVRPVVASATFTELGSLVDDGFFIATSDGDALTAAWSAFVQRYEPLLAQAGEETSIEAFGLRTMLIHDLRRIRLRWPPLPPQAHPADWPGVRAGEVAAELYSRLASASAEALSTILSLEYPQALPARFAERPLGKRLLESKK